MLKIRFPSNYNQKFGVNRLLLRYGSGVTFKDKISFFILKISYLGLRLGRRLTLRDKERKNLSAPSKMIL